VAISALRQFFDLLAKMGLSMRDDPKRVIDVAARQWGEPVDGLALSLEPVLLREDRQVMSNLSVVLRNAGQETKSLEVPGWLFFLLVELTAPDGRAVPLSPFGAELLKPSRRTERIAVNLAPGGMVETQIPIGSIFEMRASGEYRASVSCELPGGAALRSNSTALVV
jgi:hypothetical protein